MTVGDIKEALKNWPDNMPVMGFDNSNDAIWSITIDDDCPANGYQDHTGADVLFITLVDEIDRM